MTFMTFDYFINHLELVLNLIFLLLVFLFIVNAQKRMKGDHVTDAWSEGIKDIQSNILLEQEAQEEEEEYYEAEDDSGMDFFSILPTEEEEEALKFEYVNTTFDDIAGNEEAKKELQEVVRFLKDPKPFIKLGAVLPKGVLLGGPPGTGKTLFARAVAGESKTRFFKVAGSEFVEMLAGIGASRVKELFDAAREAQPSIIFIDEIDSIGKARGGMSMGGASDEREQTLNQILTEMDGFSPTTGVLVIAATNRVDILDPALIRPGRFDRQITLNLPNFQERQAILKVHAKGKRILSEVSFAQVAQRTVGFTGADLANVLNEAAILAARFKKKAISMKEISISIDRLVVGLEGRQFSRIHSRQLTAFHEMGHALIGTLVDEENQSIQKVSIVPRGSTQGITWTVPSASQYSSRQSFINQILVALSGRATEELIYGVGECTVGAQQDINQVTRILRMMIVRYSMGRLQELKQEAQQRNLYLLGSDVKQELNNIIDNFTTNFVDLLYNEIVSFLQLMRPTGERIVDELLIAEELTGREVKALTGEYINNTISFELLYAEREALLFQMLGPQIFKSLAYLDETVEELLLAADLNSSKK